jgi:hypothetical protein
LISPKPFASNSTWHLGANGCKVCFMMQWQMAPVHHFLKINPVCKGD